MTLATIQFQKNLVCRSDQFVVTERLVVAMRSTTEKFVKNFLTLFSGEGIERLEHASSTRAHTFTLPLLYSSVKYSPREPNRAHKLRAGH